MHVPGVSPQKLTGITAFKAWEIGGLGRYTNTRQTFEHVLLVGVKDTSERSNSMQLVIGLFFPLFCQRGRASFVVRGSATWVCASAVVYPHWHFVAR